MPRASLWITPILSPDNRNVRRVSISADILHPAERRTTADAAEAEQFLVEEWKRRLGHFAIMAETLAKIPEWERQSDVHMRRVIAELQLGIGTHRTQRR